MSWDSTKDYLTAFLGILLLLIPLLKESLKSKNKSKVYIIFLICSCLILLILGIDKINRDNEIKLQSDIDSKNISSLKSDLKKVIEKRKIDSINTSAFQKELNLKFNIIRDSLTNMPIIKTFNTNIKKVETLNMY